MARIHVTTDSGEVIASLSTDEYDLTKAFAKQALANEVLEACERADRREAQDFLASQGIKVGR